MIFHHMVESGARISLSNFGGSLSGSGSRVSKSRSRMMMMKVFLCFELCRVMIWFSFLASLVVSVRHSKMLICNVTNSCQLLCLLVCLCVLSMLGN